jgi:hypothetical protein
MNRYLEAVGGDDGGLLDVLLLHGDLVVAFDQNNEGKILVSMQLSERSRK